eukprot:1616136-Rhodomonas_salina.6
MRAAKSTALLSLSASFVTSVMMMLRPSLQPPPPPAFLLFLLLLALLLVLLLFVPPCSAADPPSSAHCPLAFRTHELAVCGEESWELELVWSSKSVPISAIPPPIATTPPTSGPQSPTLSVTASRNEDAGPSGGGSSPFSRLSSSDQLRQCNRNSHRVSCLVVVAVVHAVGRAGERRPGRGVCSGKWRGKAVAGFESVNALQASTLQNAQYND